MRGKGQDDKPSKAYVVTRKTRAGSVGTKGNGKVSNYFTVVTLCILYCTTDSDTIPNIDS